MRARGQSESTSKEEVAALKTALAQSRRAMVTMQRSVQQDSEKTATMADAGAKYSASLLALRTNRLSAIAATARYHSTWLACCTRRAWRRK